MHMAIEQTDVRPWYRQFWPSFIMALPLAAVIAGLTTVAIAVTHQDSVVRDDWYTEGKSINQDIARDSRATTLGINADIRSDAVTGEIRVSRMLGAFDCGRIFSGRTAASQFRGAMIMGIGLALMEETQFDERNGRIMNASLAEYHVPVHMDVPEIEVMWADVPDPRAPAGGRGAGEIGITGTAAAIANAVYNATGKRIRDLPITLDKLL